MQGWCHYMFLAQSPCSFIQIQPQLYGKIPLITIKACTVYSINFVLITLFCSLNLLCSIFHVSDPPKELSVEIDPLHKWKVSSPSQID